MVCYITYALLLPITTIIFSAPFLGEYQEHLSGFTFGGLGVVLVGFVVYQKYSSAIAEDGDNIESQALASFTESFHSDISSRPTRGQSSFQERVVGMGKAHRTRAGSLVGSAALGTPVVRVKGYA